MENDIHQYSIDVVDPVDEKKIIKALEDAGVEVLGVSYCASWTDEDYHKGRKPYSSV